MGELAQVCEGLAGCDDGAGLPVTVRRKAAEEIALVADGGHSTRLTDIRKTGANPGAPDWPFSPRSLIYRLRALRVAALRIGDGLVALSFMFNTVMRKIAGCTGSVLVMLWHNG
jgi:hypothetical protein